MKINARFALSVALLVPFTFASESIAQDVGLFNGNGIKNQWGNQQDDSSTNKNVIGMNANNVLGSNRGSLADESSNSRWKFPKIDFSKLKPNFQRPKFMQADNFPRPLQFSDTAEGGVFSTFPKLDFSGSGSSGENFFQRMNERTREIFGRTRDGFSNFSDRSRETWDSITRSLGADRSPLSGRSNIPPAQPQLRAARQADGSTTRFAP